METTSNDQRKNIAYHACLSRNTTRRDVKTYLNTQPGGWMMDKNWVKHCKSVVQGENEC